KAAPPLRWLCMISTNMKGKDIIGDVLGRNGCICDKSLKISK
ncbi:MAG: hypothetical protein ACI9FJ_003120, partial [Alteromonadaceae bacterium]